MLEKAKFVLAVEAGEASFSEICFGFGISRETGYRWWRRYREGGLEALQERSRRPQRMPHATPPDVVQRLIEARQVRPRWSARKLLAWLKRQDPTTAWPADRTGHRILCRHGLVKGLHRNRRYRFPAAGVFSVAQDPNDVWTIDFKGHFRLQNRQYCYPLTVGDLFSRYALECRALRNTSEPPTYETMQHVFREYGLPNRIRSDNGVPFASRALAGLSCLSIWFLKLGIGLERITPGHPQQNAEHERYHRTLKAEAVNPPAANFRQQQLRFDVFLREYNEQRPHEALLMKVPADVYRASKRSLPRKDVWPGLEYPESWDQRTVHTGGCIKWRKYNLFLSELLYGETVALEAVTDEACLVHFGSLVLGVVKEPGKFVAAQPPRPIRGPHSEKAKKNKKAKEVSLMS